MSSSSRSFGFYIFSSIASLLVITVIIIVGYIWHQYAKAISEISNHQMAQATEMVREKLTNYLTPAAVMAKLSSEILKDGGFDRRAGGVANPADYTKNKKDNTVSSKVSLNPLDIITPAGHTIKGGGFSGQSGILSVIDAELLESYGIHVLKAFPQLAMANIGDESGNFMMPKKFPEGKMGTKFIDRGTDPPTVIWKYRDQSGNVENIETSTDVKYDPRSRPWYKGAKESGDAYWTDVYIFFSDQTPGITTAYPLVSRNGEFLGVFSLDLALAEISTFLKGLKIGKTGVAYIINQKDELIAYPEAERIVKKIASFKITDQTIENLGKEGHDETALLEGLETLKDQEYPDKEKFLKALKTAIGESQAAQYESLLLKHAASEKLRPAKISEIEIGWVSASFEEYTNTKAHKFVFKNEGKRYLGSITDMGGAVGKSWKIGVVVPEEDFLGPLTHMKRIVPLISCLILLIALFVARLISGGISRPINVLTQEAKRIENFDLDGEIIMQSSVREIQMMNHSMASMKKGLRAFEKYVPSTLVRQLIKTGEEARLGGKKVELTILFSDIQGFTDISEKLDPEILMEQMFEYNNELTNIILNLKGTIDKYIGDAIMAFWGAPVWYEDNAFYACNAGLACLRKVEELNEKWKAEGKVPFVTRFGVNTGATIVGNMGSKERMNYSVLGDSVNLASRIEGVNKIYGTHLIITQSTYERVSDSFLCRPLDNVAVKGKKQGIRIYQLVGIEGEDLPDEILLCKSFAKGFQAYLRQEWDKALEIFTLIRQKYPDDKPTELYIQRCTDYRQTPPEKDWDGIYRLKTK
jgi:adenylate cyclase